MRSDCLTNRNTRGLEILEAEDVNWAHGGKNGTGLFLPTVQQDTKGRKRQLRVTFRRL